MFPFLLTAGSIIVGAIFGWKIVGIADNAQRDATSVAQQAVNVVDNARRDVASIGQQIINITDDFVRGVAQNVNLITDASVWSVMTLTNRVTIIMYMLAATALGLMTVCALGFLLYLSHFSPCLQAIAWTLMAAACSFMFRMYVQHSRICWHMIKDSFQSNHSTISTPTISKNPITTQSQVKQKQIQTKKNHYKQFGITVAGRNGHGEKFNQLCYPEGIFIDNDKSIYIADFGNDRIVKWKFNSRIGQVIAGGNGRGNQINQLDCPTNIIFDKENNSFIISDLWNGRVIRYFDENQTNQQILISNISCHGLTIDKSGSIYVSDWGNHEVRRWKQEDKKGELVAGGNGKGNHLNQLNCPTYIFIDKDYSLYISDRDNHRVMKWKKDAKEGIIVAGGNSNGNSLEQLDHPHGVIVDHLGQIYVADYENHRVMRWCEGDEEGEIVIGQNGKGNQSNQLINPKGLSFDNEENLYVADCNYDQIQKYEKF
ncbi:unnamed protein product [Adineta steineri]|uniref:Uncharacterized protein n=1 Tax=Adineta steineri TaxID=433720 RepID=A0A815NZB2_9BILA|nr:unnamed protein product [Adineta steineri]CAF1627996.1 unnamed protein product [Adineta steineri]